MPRLFYQNTTCTPEEFSKLQSNLPTDKKGRLIESYVPENWVVNGEVQLTRINMIFNKLNYENQGAGCFSILSAIMLGRKDQSGKPYSYEDVMDPTKLVSEKKTILDELEKAANEKNTSVKSEAIKELDKALIIGTDRMATHFEQRLGKVLRGKNPMAALMDPDLQIEADIIRNLVTKQYGNEEFKKRTENLNIEGDSVRSVDDLRKKIGDLLIPVIGYPQEAMKWLNIVSKEPNAEIKFGNVNTILENISCIQYMAKKMTDDPNLDPSDALNGHIGVGSINSESIDQIEEEISKKEDVVDKEEYKKIKPMLQLTKIINQNPITRRGAVEKLFDGTLCEKITLKVNSNEMHTDIHLNQIESMEIAGTDESELVGAASSYFPKDIVLEMAKIPFGEEIKGLSDTQFKPELWSAMVKNLEKFNQKCEEVKNAGEKADDFLLFKFRRAASSLMKCCRNYVNEVKVSKYVKGVEKSEIDPELKVFCKKAADLNNHISWYGNALAAANDRRLEEYYVHPFSDEVMKNQMDTLRLLQDKVENIEKNKVENIEKNYEVRDIYKISVNIGKTINALKGLQEEINSNKDRGDYSFETATSKKDLGTFLFGNDEIENYDSSLNCLYKNIKESIEEAEKNGQIALKEAFEECIVWIRPWLVHTKCSIANTFPEGMPKDRQEELQRKREKAAEEKRSEHAKEQENAPEQDVEQENAPEQVIDPKPAKPQNEQVETDNVLQKMIPPSNETVTNLRNLGKTLLGSKWTFNAFFGKTTKEFTNLSDAIKGLNKQLDTMAKYSNGTSAQSVPKDEFERYVKKLETVQQTTDDYMNYKYNNLNSDFAGSRYESASKLADLVNKELEQCRDKLLQIGVTRAVTNDAYVEKESIANLKKKYHKNFKDKPNDPKLGARPVVAANEVELQNMLNLFYDDMCKHSSLRNHFKLDDTANAVKYLQRLSKDRVSFSKQLNNLEVKKRLIDSVVTLVAYGIIKANPDIANRESNFKQLKENISKNADVDRFAEFVNETDPAKQTERVKTINDYINGVLNGDGGLFDNEKMADELRKGLDHSDKSVDGPSIKNDAPEKEELGKS